VVRGALRFGGGRGGESVLYTIRNMIEGPKEQSGYWRWSSRTTLRATPWPSHRPLCPARQQLAPSIRDLQPWGSSVLRIALALASRSTPTAPNILVSLPERGAVGSVPAAHPAPRRRPSELQLAKGRSALPAQPTSRRVTPQETNIPPCHPTSFYTLPSGSTPRPDHRTRPGPKPNPPRSSQTCAPPSQHRRVPLAGAKDTPQVGYPPTGPPSPWRRSPKSG